MRASYRFVGIFVVLAVSTAALGQRQTVGVPQYSAAGTIPDINVGGTYMDSQFSKLDFAQMMLDQQSKDAKVRAEQRKQAIDSGTVSVFDLEAPPAAVSDFNQAAMLLKQQKSKEAIPHLEKAIKRYPKFVSAHQDLGVAYEDLDDAAHARAEFQIAADTDPKFPAPLLHLGRLELAENNPAAAQSDFEKASSIRTKDANVLMMLCYAQNLNHQFQDAVSTAARVHGFDHAGMANVHYIAAASAIELHDYATVKRELDLFVQEDPKNPLAPAAQKQLAILARNASAQLASNAPLASPGSAQPVQTFPDSERLRTELASLGEDEASCSDCAVAPNAAPADPTYAPMPAPADLPHSGYTFRKSVDEVAMFFAVTDHGHNVEDLRSNEVAILDANRPPNKILQFTPQSKLPLHFGLLIDTSGSVRERFGFEKHAAERFVQKMLSNASDLAFVAGFSVEPNVTQDFSAQAQELQAGIEKLQNAGGTALFDAISYACWKLAAYPERERVANVLVVLTDGEDNSSKTSLKQAIRDAQATGVTIYAISTQDHPGAKTDADKVLVALAERTGGEALFPGDLQMLSHAFDKLHELVRSRYFVAYRPANFSLDSTYRPVTITASRGGRKLTVHSRKGYYARLGATPLSAPKQ